MGTLFRYVLTRFFANDTNTASACSTGQLALTLIQVQKSVLVSYKPSFLIYLIVVTMS